MRPVVKPRWARKPRDTAMVRIATLDLKIAAISVASNALLLTANRRDFEKVPGLRFENWLE
jgi:tRNA(fMet)-specific endonuclease VapC